MTTVTNEDYWLHVVRNPWGHSEDQVRAARLNLSDAFEQLQREIKAERALVTLLGSALSDLTQHVLKEADGKPFPKEVIPAQKALQTVQASRARTFGGESC